MLQGLITTMHCVLAVADHGFHFASGCLNFVFCFFCFLLGAVCGLHKTAQTPCGTFFFVAQRSKVRGFRLHVACGTGRFRFEADLIFPVLRQHGLGVFKLRHGLQHFLLCSLVALQCFICSLRQHLCVCANACNLRRAAQKAGVSRRGTAGERTARIDNLPVQADDTVAEPNTPCNLRRAVKVFCNNSAAEQRIADAGVLLITVAEC